MSCVRAERRRAHPHVRSSFTWPQDCYQSISTSRSYKTHPGWWMTRAQDTSAARMPSLGKSFNSTNYLCFALRYQSHNPQFSDSSRDSHDRLPHCGCQPAHTLIRWKEIIIFKFNLFLIKYLHRVAGRESNWIAGGCVKIFAEFIIEQWQSRFF